MKLIKGNKLIIYQEYLRGQLFEYFIFGNNQKCFINIKNKISIYFSDNSRWEDIREFINIKKIPFDIIFYSDNTSEEFEIFIDKKYCYFSY